MEESHFDETQFFSAIQTSGARALLIGRRALIALGLPLLTRDYDFWLHTDDIVVFNQAVEVFDLLPNRSPEESRSQGRYVLQNDEMVDVLIAAKVHTVDGAAVLFSEVWQRRREIEVGPGIEVAIPQLDDLILTKRFASRPKDLEDLRLLEILRSSEGNT